MDDGRPTLEFVVTVVVEHIRKADGEASASRLDRGKGGMIVHQIIG
jgi:hypothetical protein